jgi:hypothetical protein
VAKHEQAEVSANGMHARIDVGLVALIEVLWTAGIRTRFSCQAASPPTTRVPSGYRGAWSWITFERSADLERMLRLIARRAGYASELSLRTLGLKQPAWRYRIWPTFVPGRPMLDVHYMAYFPSSDIEQIVSVLTPVSPSRQDLEGQNAGRLPSSIWAELGAGAVPSLLRLTEHRSSDGHDAMTTEASTPITGSTMHQ